MDTITIGITDCGRYDKYASWMANHKDVNVLKLSYQQHNIQDIDECDGILLTGGQDVHPRYYNKMEYIDYYKNTIPDIDEKRDEFELEVLEHSQKNALPVLGICRGLQISNIFFGGTLVLDIPSLGKRNHSKIKEGEDRYHSISVTPGSALERISGTSEGIVNSAHHQSALKVSESLAATAFSEDGVIEALERKEINGYPYLLLVQWHPERMTDQHSVFSLNIKNSFLDAVKKIGQVENIISNLKK